MHSISILHPSYKRPKLAKQCYDEWISKAKEPKNIEYVLCLAQNDPYLSEYMEIFRGTKAIRIIHHENGLVKQVNTAAKEASGNLLVAISDDFGCPENWDKILFDATFPKSCFAVKIDDGLQPFIMTLPIMDRAFYDAVGGHIYHPEYYHMYGDEELANVAKKMGATIVVDALFPHNHYSTGVNKKDEVNVQNDSYMMVDRVTFKNRKAINFGI
jgi:glycosyltransferase involved in cell wall biosynthesis